MIAITIFIGGCLTDGHQGAKAMSPGEMGTVSTQPSLGEQAVVAMKGPAIAVFTSPATGRGGHPTAYCAPGSHRCAECERAAGAYLEGGKLAEACELCGARRTVIPRQNLTRNP
jgi:hypothetical protein